MVSEQSINRAVAFLCVAACLLLVQGVMAEENPGQGPYQLVQSVTGQMVDAMRSDRGKLQKDPRQLVALMEKIVAPHIDFGLMGREVLGRYWGRADKQQHACFQAAFKQLLIDDYTAAFRNYSNQTVEMLPPHPASGKDRALVSTDVNTPGSPRLRVDYRLHRDGGVWRIYDVDVSGVSLLLNYRDAFEEQLQHGNVAELTAAIEKKNRAFRL
jgi:phospholipid transport system substrate-binding protein